jgi:hypothetical protein
LKSNEILFWAGLISWVAACIGLGAIGLRNTAWLGTHRSVLSNLKPIDIKISKGSGFLFIIGLVLFALGFLLK